MSANLKKWRDAATLILAAKQPILLSKSVENINYKLLTMKRSAKSTFPNAHVFPGGTLDKSDCSIKWLDLYKKFGINDQKFDILKKVKYIAPIFINDENLLSRHISLRICAIRETFEECGVLLCKSAKQKNDGKISLCASYFGEFEIKEWQKRVHNDAAQFIELCNKFEIYPDIWALHEWANWLTPVKFDNRFDAIFFIANIPNNVPTFAEDTEVQQIDWSSPAELLEKNMKNEIVLIPAQYYELSRLLTFSKIEDLALFSSERCKNGTRRILPQVLKTKKYNVALFPGDDLYPGEELANSINNNIFEDIPEMKIVHRIYGTGGIYAKFVIKNHEDNTGHKNPVQYIVDDKSRL